MITIKSINNYNSYQFWRATQ